MITKEVKFLPERPFDLLEQLRGKYVKITLTNKDHEEIVAELLGFDVHVNLVLRYNNKYRFLLGKMVAWIEDASNLTLEKKEAKK